MQYKVLFLALFCVNSLVSSRDANPSRKECNYVVNSERIDHVLCTKLNSLSDLSELMRPSWTDVVIKNRPSFPFVVDGEFFDSSLPCTINYNTNFQNTMQNT